MSMSKKERKRKRSTYIISYQLSSTCFPCHFHGTAIDNNPLYFQDRKSVPCGVKII